MDRRGIPAPDLQSNLPRAPPGVRWRDLFGVQERHTNQVETRRAFQERKRSLAQLTDCADAECADYRERCGVDADKAVVHELPHGVVDLEIKVFSKLPEKIFNLLVKLAQRLQGANEGAYRIKLGSTLAQGQEAAS